MLPVVGVPFACGPARPGELGAPRVALVDVPEAELTVAGVPTLPVPGAVAEGLVLSDPGWLAFSDPERPLEPDPTRLAVTRGEELVPGAGSAPRAVLSLEGTRGACFRRFTVEPSTPYRFRVRVRAREVVPAARPFHGAAPFLAELERHPTEDELAGSIDPLVVTRHLFDTAADEAGWVLRERTFRTGAQTHALAVALVLGLSEEVESGGVDFAAAELRPLSEAEYQHHLLDGEREAFFASLGGPEQRPTGWRAQRLVRGRAGADTRPSILLFPGESLRFRVRHPEGRAGFRAGIAPWAPALEGRSRVWTRVLDYELTLAVSDGYAGGVGSVTGLGDGRTEWEEWALELRELRGEWITVTFTVKPGPVPLLFGAPELFDVEARSELPNLLLISLDTLRADRLGCYGYPEDTSPRLDAFAAEAIRFDDVTSQASYTLPAHATMFSGQHPSVHGILTAGPVFQAARSPILARRLRERGYATQAFTGGGFVSADFGMDNGFDGFVEIDPMRPRDSAYFAVLERRAPERYTREAIEANGMRRVHHWLAEHAGRPFFLFLHTYTVHDYDPPPQFARCAERGCTSTRTDWRAFKYADEPTPPTPEDRAHLGHRYDDALRYVDSLVGELLDELERLDLDGRTIVAITSDHGEELFERGFVQHGKTLYEEITRVPWILRLPGVGPRLVDEPAMLADLVPTLERPLGLLPDPRVQGRDALAPAVAPRVLWSEIDDALAHRYALRDGEGWKLIHSPPGADVKFPGTRPFELYDLRERDLEGEEVGAAHPERLERMRARLEEELRALEDTAAGLSEVRLGEGPDAAALEQLEALGYGG